MCPLFYTFFTILKVCRLRAKRSMDLKPPRKSRIKCFLGVDRIFQFKSGSIVFYTSLSSRFREIIIVEGSRGTSEKAPYCKVFIAEQRKLVPCLF